MRYFEDFRVGDVTELGPVTVTEDEIVEFASRYDPQPFHVDAEAARQTMYGGLIASGWHTTSLMMRQLVDHYVSPESSLGAAGVDEIRWPRPVRPGDTLRGRSTILEMRDSFKDPRRGTVYSLNEVLNQEGVVVMTMKARGFFAKRP